MAQNEKKRGVLIVCSVCWCHRWVWAVPEAAYTFDCDRCTRETTWWNTKALSFLRGRFGKPRNKPAQGTLPSIAPHTPLPRG